MAEHTQYMNRRNHLYDLRSLMTLCWKSICGNKTSLHVYFVRQLHRRVNAKVSFSHKSNSWFCANFGSRYQIVKEVYFKTISFNTMSLQIASKLGSDLTIQLDIHSHSKCLKEQDSSWLFPQIMYIRSNIGLNKQQIYPHFQPLN